MFVTCLQYIWNCEMDVVNLELLPQSFFVLILRNQDPSVIYKTTTMYVSIVCGWV